MGPRFPFSTKGALALVAQLLLSGAASATDWVQTTGPGVTGVRAFASNGGALYAGTDTRGVYRSEDVGLHWDPSNVGIEELPVTAVFASPSLLLAGAEWTASMAGGVYRSLDGGASWSFSGLANETVLCFLANGPVIFAGTGSGSIFRTTNQGVTWSSSSAGLFGGSVNGLVAASGTIFAACGQGLFRSTDQGASWEPVSGFEFYNLFSMGQSGAVLFAGGFNGILRSTNGGASWSHVEVPSDELVRFTAFAFSGATAFAASAGFGETQVYRSTDQGATWTPLVGAITGVENEALFSSGTVLLAGGPDKGVMATTDGGSTWDSRTLGLAPGGSIRSIVLDGTALYAGTAGNGVWKSGDLGDTWARSDASEDGALANELVPGLAVRSGKLFAVTSQHGAYRSIDGGESWQLVNAGFPDPLPFMLSIVVAGSDVLVGTDAGIFRSTDDGATWVLRTVASQQCNGLAFSDGFVYALVNTGFGSTTGVYRSDNFGLSWGLVFPSGSLSLTSIAADGAFVYAGDLLDGMVRSGNHGTSWVFLDPVPGEGVYAILPHGADLFIGCGPATEGAYRSADHGGTWTPWGDGLSPDVSVEHLAADAVALYAGTDRQAMWRRDLPGIVSSPDVAVNTGVILAPLASPLLGDGAVSYFVPQTTLVRVDLVDVQGRTIRTFTNARREPGWHRERLATAGLSSGVYYVRLLVGSEIRRAKLVLPR